MGEALGEVGVGVIARGTNTTLRERHEKESPPELGLHARKPGRDEPPELGSFARTELAKPLADFEAPPADMPPPLATWK
jgi:hypothetical protein